MSKCDAFVCAPSNVSHAVLYLNPDIPFYIPKELQVDAG